MAMQVELSGSVSSQYLTALLMAAPLATGTSGIDIRITDELVSQPYVDMTVRLMERFGVMVSHAWAARVPCTCMYTNHLAGGGIPAKTGVLCTCKYWLLLYTRW